MSQILLAAAELCLAPRQRRFGATAVASCPEPPGSGMLRVGTAPSAGLCQPSSSSALTKQPTFSMKPLHRASRGSTALHNFGEGHNLQTPRGKNWRKGPEDRAGKRCCAGRPSRRGELLAQDHLEVTKKTDPAVIKTRRHMVLQSLPLRNQVGGFVSQQHVLKRQP